MKRIAIFPIIIFFTISFFTSCIKNEAIAPGYVIYKTKGNYNDLIFIRLSKDKKMVVQYPGPSDVYYINKNEDTILRTPTILHKDYLLDNKGINTNAVFIDISYAEFSKRESSLSQEEMMNMIVDDDPFTEYWYGKTGNLRSKDFEVSIEEINEIIDNNEIDKYFERRK
ncbi:MAG: hypothetical protein KAT68_08670 [Bacteroidales bacterium]|nr:hypothetical protein [Bacteroidales bacterium]